MEDLDIQIPTGYDVHEGRTKVRVENDKVVVESTWVGDDEPCLYMVLSPSAAFDIGRKMIDAASKLGS